MRRCEGENTMNNSGWNASEDRVPIDILLIEDRDEAIEMVEGAIHETRLRNRMVVARSQIEALHYLRHAAAFGPVDVDHGLSKPGLILLDINMDKQQGFDVLHEIRTDPKLMTIPVVVLTDNLQESDLAYTISHGVTGYFLKPMDPGQLRKVVRDVEDHWNLLWNAPCAN
ncbi:MAG: response regulator [bacterium]|nr:response regulator [bacterium]